MRKRKQESNAEHDPFGALTNKVQAIVTRHKEALTQLEETTLPPELKGSVESELSELLVCAIRALYKPASDVILEEELVAQLGLAFADRDEPAAALAAVEGEEEESGR